MENLPTPLSRVELYLAKACGMDVTVPEQPLSRLEQFLAILAGDTSITMPAPMSLTEQWLAYVLGVTPDPLLAVEGARLIGAQKVDVRYFAVAAGMPGATLPEAPQNRAEMYWAYIAINPPSPGVLKYVTGSNITLTDVTSTKLESVQVNGNTFQQTYTGKNLLNSLNGFTKAYISNQGEIIYDSSGTNALFNYTDVSSSTTYAFSQHNPTVIQNVGIAYFDADKIYISRQQVPNVTSTTFTTPNDCKFVRIWVYRSGGVTQSILEQAELQFERNNSATSYEPFVGRTPSPSPSYPQPINVVTGEQTVTVTGKNLFGAGTIASYTYCTATISNNIITVTPTGTGNPQVRLNLLKSLPAGTYTLNSDTYLSVATILSGSDNTLVYNMGANYDKVTFTSTAEAVRITFNFANPNNTNPFTVDLTTLQIEAGPTATTYEPYQSQTYTVSLGSTELCKIGTYQDYIYKSGDDWYVHKTTDKYTFTGNETFNYQSTYTGFTINSANVQTYMPDVKVPMDGYSDCFIVEKTTTTWTDNNKLGLSASGTFWAKSTAFGSTQQTCETWLSTNTPTVYYALATPTDTKITDSTLISQLNALAGATLYKGTTCITVGATSPNLPADLKIGYYGEAE